MQCRAHSNLLFPRYSSPGAEVDSPQISFHPMYCIALCSKLNNFNGVSKDFLKMAFVLIYGDQFGHGLTSPAYSGCAHLKDVFSVKFCLIHFRFFVIKILNMYDKDDNGDADNNFFLLNCLYSLNIFVRYSLYPD